MISGEQGESMRFWCLIISTIMLIGCERRGEQPNCTETFSPQDYGRFMVNETQGLAQHISGTVWYRCKAGQSFQGKKCLGEPFEMTRIEADSYLQDFSKKSGEQWRLPTKSEFKEIIEKSCDSPALNPNVFPGLTVENYWLNEDSWHGDRFACSIYIYQGSVFCRQRSDASQPILMVRD
jgi:hypothetical protein